jgi:hypothetical protein
MNDPGSALQAPPPRYLLESDSSDEEGQGEYADSSSRRRTQPQPVAEARIEWTIERARDNVSEMVIGIGQAGRYLKRKMGQGADAMKVLHGSAQVGTGSLKEGCLLVLLDDAEGEDAWTIAKSVSAIASGLETW